jgi:hypothetical protein
VDVLKDVSNTSFFRFAGFQKWEMRWQKERQKNVMNSIKHTTTDFFIMVVQVGDQSATKIISRIKGTVMIRLVMTDELDCFCDAFKKSGPILIRLGVAMQLFHLDSNLARFCHEMQCKLIPFIFFFN